MYYLQLHLSFTAYIHLHVINETRPFMYKCVNKRVRPEIKASATRHLHVGLVTISQS